MHKLPGPSIEELLIIVLLSQILVSQLYVNCTFCRFVRVSYTDSCTVIETMNFWNNEAIVYRAVEILVFYFPTLEFQLS